MANATFNLLRDPWLPIRTTSGTTRTIRPAEIADPGLLAPDWPRPDFRIATLEFLIGLLATACPPRTSADWGRWWKAPPTTDELDEAFAPIAHAFDLDGDGPRFLQDIEDLVAGSEAPEKLLIEAPGESTTKKNTDLLIKRNRVAVMGLPAAAITLQTLQSMAPAGGAGNRVGLRGGGPLITLVVPGLRPTLWQLLWANTPRGEVPEATDLKRVFPWLAPTLTSDKGRVVTPEANAHPLQVFWSVPRRIRLDIARVQDGAACELTGQPAPLRVTGWRQRPYGAQYAAWQHPLTPYYQQKTDRLAVHPQPGGIGYRHWLGLVVKRPKERYPAGIISTWRGERARAQPGLRLLAAGYDMDNMKARSFIESEMPLPGSADPAIQQAIDELARSLVGGAELAAATLRTAVRRALFSEGASVKLDWELLSSVREQLWDATEGAFFGALGSAARPEVTAGTIGDVSDAARKSFAGLLRKVAIDLFDAAAPLTIEAKDAARIAKARRHLGFALNGFGKDGEALFNALGVPLPPRKKDAA